MKQPIWIEACDALVIHDRLLVIRGGAPGLVGRSLLDSALARPKHRPARSLR